MTQPPPQPPSYSSTSKTGISAMGTTTHVLLSIFTCGCWLPIWFLHWLFTRNKTTTYQRPL